jgi:hypothetical protein
VKDVGRLSVVVIVRAAFLWRVASDVILTAWLSSVLFWFVTARSRSVKVSSHLTRRGTLAPAAQC